jgi:hypothetical protein
LVSGYVHAVTRFRVDKAEVAFERRIELVRRQHVDDHQLRAGRGQLADHAVGGRIEQVGEQDDDPASRQLRGRMPGSGEQIGRAIGGPNRRQVAEQPEHPARAAQPGPPA